MATIAAASLAVNSMFSSACSVMVSGGGVWSAPNGLLTDIWPDTSDVGELETGPISQLGVMAGLTLS